MITYTRPYFSLICIATGKSSANSGGKNSSACFFSGVVPAGANQQVLRDHHHIHVQMHMQDSCRRLIRAPASQQVLRRRRPTHANIHIQDLCRHLILFPL